MSNIGAWVLETYMNMELEEQIHCMPVGKKPRTHTLLYIAEGSTAWAKRHHLLEIKDDASALPKLSIPREFTRVQCKCKHCFYADFHSNNSNACPMCARKVSLPSYHEAADLGMEGIEMREVPNARG